jgi:hypothetical protein
MTAIVSSMSKHIMISPICQFWVDFLARISYSEIDKYPKTLSLSRDLPAPNCDRAAPNSD